MRIVLSLFALTLATGAAAQQTTAPALDRTPRVVVVEGAPHTTPMLDRRPALDMPGDRVCRDRIRDARADRGLPGEAASPEPEQLIAAVDHRINGCSVMVMRNDTSDVRPLPSMPDGPPQLQRIPGG